MSGRLGDLSAAQEAALAGLKDRIKDVITDRCDDQYLLRFLRSRQFDLEKTEKKIRATLEFRKKYGADTILKDWTPPPLFAQYFPAGHLPRPDKTDHLIVVLCLGNLDMKGLMKCNAREELVKAKVFTMERTESMIKKIAKDSGKHHDNVTAIVDMEGLSAHQLWRPGLQLFSEFMQIEEMHYPEIANRVLIIKPPRIFPTIYALVKPFVDPNTREKIEIISGNNYKERLLEVTTLDNLPERYGGTLKDAPQICWGGRVPKDNYKENDESLQHQYVKPGKSFVIEVEAQEGQELSWLFITENHDIAFGLYHVVGGENQELIPSERHAAHLGSVESSIICEKSGTYILEWDNSFSWTRGKNLRYRYEVAAPKDV